MKFNIDRIHIYFYKLTLCLIFVTFFFNLFAFCTPFWLISWPRLHTPFKMIGLWTVCFDGLTLKRDEIMQTYYGCWWIYSTYFWRIRKFLFPGWFVIVQITSTISIVLDMVCIILLLTCRNSSLKGTISSIYHYLFSFQLLQDISGYFTKSNYVKFGVKLGIEITMLKKFLQIMINENNEKSIRFMKSKLKLQTK
ncbi:hypothetical protein A3Q56_00385 [Intoshia linei]|uniref:Uncharacterized protein n=1 Tax=Intoshia linei TaxID=1819745 RepID=A0A177BDQ1_9BILA|nr:hypothetical protein A3Q56_00385 [Intoshia linei]